MPTLKLVPPNEVSETSASSGTAKKKTPDSTITGSTTTTKRKTPDNLSQKSIHAFFPKSSDSKENVKINVEGKPPKKKTKYQCECCRTIFDNHSECVKHVERCDARKPSAKKSSNPKKKEKDDEEATKKKKRKRKSKIPSEPKGDLAVNVRFKDGTNESLTIESVYTGVFGDEAMMLTGEYPAHSKRAIKNFLHGFGRFVW
eukprot:scaffold373217_cov70-Cyclotella_meneghiniana.AAC.2